MRRTHTQEPVRRFTDLCIEALIDGRAVALIALHPHATAAGGDTGALGKLTSKR